ncbi:MAG: multicopper oxidase domain-containing protein, partial [Phormidesmis sp. CAN_BIN44]|nr:multicopper oxidase domain-containing protein [Phormidesmis sp. CAN_BIN44]
MKKISRRDALKLGAIAGGTLLLPIGLQSKSYAGDAGSPKVTPFSLPFKVPPLLNPVRSDSTTDYYQIKVNKARVSLLPGLTSEVFSYNGSVPGPTIVQRQGRQSVVRFINDSIGTPTSTHLHGMASLPQYDGYAEDLIFPGQYKDYIYPNNRAATLWYHDHAIHKTAPNVYKGLAAFYLVKDDFEAGLNLPSGAYDVPLLLKDVIFGADGTVIYDDQGEKSLMGDVITVNGVAWPRMEVANRKYRFRLCNGSISRSYQLALSNGAKFTMIGTDAGLMGAPVEVANFRIGS